MIADETSVLEDPAMLARVQEIILAGLAGCTTWTALQRLVQRAVITVDPDGTNFSWGAKRVCRSSCWFAQVGASRRPGSCATGVAEAALSRGDRR